MPNSSQLTPRFAVIGGGISGLTAAYRLRQLLPQAVVEVFESSDRLGGVLATHRIGDFLVERGADSFITKQPWAADLCRELEIEKDLIPTNTAYRRALVLRDGQLYPVPEGFVLIRPQRVVPILKSPLLSWRGKIRLIAERWWRPPRDLSSPQFDDNLAHFAIQRLGREVYERLVEPLVAGIYTADANQLSVVATMPEVIDSLRKHHTLWHADEQETDTVSGARYGSFVTFRDGIGRLIDELASRLSAGSVLLNKSINRVTRDEGAKWQVETDVKHGPFDGVVIAVPTPQAATLLHGIDSRLAEVLGSIDYASSAVVSLAFRQNQIGKRLSGFGFVVPRVEKRDIVAASFSSVKFPARAPDDTVLIRVFLGGALRPELVSRGDAELQEIATRELRQILDIAGDPLLVDVARWHEKMPQYHVGHLSLVDEIEQRVTQILGLALAGNGYHGVGIPYCVRSGELAARRLVETCGVS